MVSAAIVGATGGGVAGPVKSLWIEGNDMLRQPGTPGNLYGIPLGSIVHDEQGPGGVSSLTFTIQDPLKVISLRRGDDVLYHNHVTDRPYFRGWVQAWDVLPWGVGRKYHVRCQGIEIALDWMKILSLTIPAATRLPFAIQACVAAATGIGVPLRAAAQSLGLSGFGGSFSFPLADFQDISGDVETVDVITLTSVSLREGINRVIAGSRYTGFDELRGVEINAAVQAVVTVDPWANVRAYGKSAKPSDYANLTVTDTGAGTTPAEGLTHTTDVGVVPAAVAIVGGNAAGTGVTPLGDGIPGNVAIVTDSTITSNAARQSVAAAYLTEQAFQPQRGEFNLTDHGITANVHPGSDLVLTDAETGATGTYKIMSITRTFTGTRESWHVSYGSLRKALAASVKRFLAGGPQR